MLRLPSQKWVRAREPAPVSRKPPPCSSELGSDGRLPHFSPVAIHCASCCQRFLRIFAQIWLRARSRAARETAAIPHHFAKPEPSRELERPERAQCFGCRLGAQKQKKRILKELAKGDDVQFVRTTHPPNKTGTHGGLYGVTSHSQQNNQTFWVRSIAPGAMH